MIYYYHCYRGAHLSSVASALHLGLIHPNASVSELLNLEYFDVLQPEDMGTPVLAGYDEDHNPVYFVGLGKGGKIFSQFVDSFVGELNVKLEYKTINCLQCIGMITRIGGFLSHYKCFRRFGRYLAAVGVHKYLGEIHRLVLQAKGS